MRQAARYLGIALIGFNIGGFAFPFIPDHIIGWILLGTLGAVIPSFLGADGLAHKK